MRGYIKHTFFLLLVLALLGIFLAPVVTVSADQPVAIETVSQLVVNDPVTSSLDIITQEVTVQPVAVDLLDTYHKTIADAAAELRTRLINREDPIVIGLKWHNADTSLPRQVLDEAFCHTGVPNEGDYLLRHYGGCWMSRGGSVMGSEYYLSLTYYGINYFTSTQQEAEVGAAVETLLDQLDVWNKSDYEKVKAVYDYICNNVTYDHDGLAEYNAGREDYTLFSAWKALTKGTSVCQGYANLFYRLMLELGVDNRIISGTGNGGAHAWNIVKLGGLYYNLDATWDSEMPKWNLDYAYFLRSPANFTDHIRDSEFEEEFHEQYPMGEQDFNPNQVVAGDMNGDDELNDADALYLLRFTLFPSRYPLAMDGDVNSDGAVSDADALYLLRHTLFPARYPLYPAA